MRTKLTTILLVTVLVVGMGTPSEARNRKHAKPATTVLYLNWLGDCTGSGFLDTKPTMNSGACALYFPGAGGVGGSSYDFPAAGGVPFELDAARDLSLDIELQNVASVAATFDVVVNGSIDGDDKEIASGSQTVTAPAGAASVHLDLPPDKALDGAVVNKLDLTVTWSGGVTYSSIDIESGTSNLVVPRLK